MTAQEIFDRVATHLHIWQQVQQSSEHQRLLGALEGIRDWTPFADWPQELHALAEREGLNPSIITKLWGEA